MCSNNQDYQKKKNAISKAFKIKARKIYASFFTLFFNVGSHKLQQCTGFSIEQSSTALYNDGPHQLEFPC